jgi:RNA recognition motif-containing protein
MPSREGSRVFLGNLPHDVRERDIEKFFEKYGRVRNIFIKNGRYGFCVSFLIHQAWHSQNVCRY